MQEGNQSAKSETARREEEILEFWRTNDIFKKSLEKHPTRGEFVFYEGPPTANGKPGIHHLESRAFKDAVPRFRTMQGFHVRRKAGWDTHGLPVEIEVEKEIGSKHKKDIEAYGVAAFNKKCKESVLRYIDVWRAFSDRIAFWVDHSDTYFTFQNNYIESIWNIVKKVNERGLLEKDYKVLPWCPRCGTALSSHEVAQGYAEAKDPAVYVKFKLLGRDEYILAWTTTPWTLPGNVALAVGEKIPYVLVKTEAGNIWLAKARKDAVAPEAEILEEKTGDEMIGWEYEPLYPYLRAAAPSKQQAAFAKAYKIYPANFVSTEDGTGIVHTAVMYGVDDFDLGSHIGLPKFHLVDEEGKFIDAVPPFAGMFVKKADKEIIEDLEKRALLFSVNWHYEHTYPFCWRCKTPLLYYARDSWYIRMSQIKQDLIRENEGIHWEPEHIREGRFGEWLKDLKDWAISRSRYWGTPLPIWWNEEHHSFMVIGSLEELKSRAKTRGNTYFVMRHGEAEQNVKNIVFGGPSDNFALTDTGVKQIRESAKSLQGKGIKKIYASPIRRARESAEEAAAVLGLSNSDIVYDDRLQEFDFGDMNGKPFADFITKRLEMKELSDAIPGGESYLDAKRRFGSWLKTTDLKHEKENILVISHGIALESLLSASSGMNAQEELTWLKTKSNFRNADIFEFSYTPLPMNEDFELDLHRPYIDDIRIVDDNGLEYERIPEVLDVWFDSGAMPFAQDHYPFENKAWVDGPGYPADYICEAIDQTRGWFYTLHAIGCLTGRGKAYKNVICLGHILDAKGKKMSKSVGNIVEPNAMIDKYGVDALRYFMFTVNAPGDSKNFDERMVDEIVKKNIGRLNNVLAFYKLYDDGTVRDWKSENLLDRWILARLDQLIQEVTDGFEKYQLDFATRPIAGFIDDLSVWYLRRSRERFKESGEDKTRALATLRYVLHALSRVMAPTMPFFAEYLFQAIREEEDEESVHLSMWPTPTATANFFSRLLGNKSENQMLVEAMGVARSIVTSALEEREKAGIKIRQPLQTLHIPKEMLTGELLEEILRIIAEEINVKEVLPSEVETIKLETEISEELRQEGIIREARRALQGARKAANLKPSDLGKRAVLTISANDDVVISEHLEVLKELARVEELDILKRDELPSGTLSAIIE